MEWENHMVEASKEVGVIRELPIQIGHPERAGASQKGEEQPGKSFSNLFQPILMRISVGPILLHYRMLHLCI